MSNGVLNCDDFVRWNNIRVAKFAKEEDFHRQKVIFAFKMKTYTGNGHDALLSDCHQSSFSAKFYQIEFKKPIRKVRPLPCAHFKVDWKTKRKYFMLENVKYRTTIALACIDLSSRSLLVAVAWNMRNFSHSHRWTKPLTEHTLYPNGAREPKNRKMFAIHAISKRSWHDTRQWKKRIKHINHTLAHKHIHTSTTQTHQKMCRFNINIPLLIEKLYFQNFSKHLRNVLWNFSTHS